MPFIALHKEIQSSCPPNPVRDSYAGRVIEVEIIHDAAMHCTVRTIDEHKQVFQFSKWPRNHWGKLRGVFKARSEAKEVLEKPIPKFDADGNFINKISKSDQK